MKKIKIFYILISIIAFITIVTLPLKLQPAQKITLSIFSLALLLWITEAVPLYITSLIILFLEASLLPSYNIPLKSIVASFFAPILLLFLGGFALARGLQIYRTDEKIVSFITSHSSKKPQYLLLIVMSLTAFLSMWMSNTATTALMIAIMFPIVDRLSSGEPFKKAFLLGVPFASNIGGMGTPIGTPPNALALEFINETGKTIGFLQWMMYGIPLVIILLFLLWILLTIIYKPRIKRMPELKLKDKLKFQQKEGIVIGITIFTIILWLTTSLHKISSSIVALIPIITFGALSIMKKKDFLNLSWDVLILIGGGLSLGFAMKQTGLTKIIIDSVGFNSLGSFLSISLLIIMVVIMTNFMSNTSSAALILPIASSLCMSGIELIAIAFAASTAMLLPISTPPNAIAYGSGKLKVKDFIVTGSIITILSTIIILIFIYLLR